MRRVASFSAKAAWKEWHSFTKLDLCSHPVAEVLSVKGNMQLCGAMGPSNNSSQQPTTEARNSNALLETRP